MNVGQVVARLGADSRDLERGLRRAEVQAGESASRIGGLFRNALSTTLGLGLFEALKSGFKATVVAAVDFNAMLETAQMGFTTMLGSAEKAQAFLDEMANFAMKTPFEFPELLDASKRMLAYGFTAEEVLPTLMAVGDAAAALGSGNEGIDRITLALAQIRAKGKLSAEEMRQLTEAGVPAWHILADAMGKTVPELQDMVSKGLIPGYKAVEMLTAGMTQRFGGMMANMENTWQGVTSSIKDIWRMTIGAVTQNLFQGVASWLQGVRDFAVGFYNTFQKYGLQRAIFEFFGPEVATMVSVLGAVMRGLASAVKAVTGFFMQYGKQIKFVAIVMGTYLALTRAVILAKQMMIAVTAVLNGTIAANVPVLSALSIMINTYRLQVALAPVATNIFTAALYRLQAALYAVHAALGPVGWVILAISLAVAGGITLWNKYTKSVNEAWESAMKAKMAEQQEKLMESIKGATGATEEQADILSEVGKVAGKNIQSFDEVHQLQEDMADSAKDLTKSMGLEDTSFGVPEIAGFEIPDMGAQLEEMKPTLKGFWEWIKQGAGNLWDNVKEKWNQFWNWVKSWGIWKWIADKWNDIKSWAGDVWEGTKEKWNQFWSWVKSWGIWKWIANKWDDVKTWTGNVWDGAKGKWNDFKLWVGSWAAPLWDDIKKKWGDFKGWAADMWEGVKDKWGNFTSWVQEKWSNFKTKAGEIWEGVKTNVQTKWEVLKTNAPIIWEDIKTSIQTRWENLKTNAGETWNSITTGIEEKWNLLKTNAPIAWENIKTSIQDRWDSLVSGASEKWGNIKSTISEKWEELKTNAPTVWGNIKDEISQRWEELKVNAPTTWENIKKEISDRWEALKTNAPITWNNISKIIKDSWENLKANVPTTWNDIKEVIADKWQEIKEEAFNWGKNLISSFVEGIKNKINSVKSTLQGVGQTIKNFLGFSSPTKEGPGRFADEWAPNLMNMFAEGLNQNIPKVRSVVDEVAQQLTGMTVQPTVQQSIMPATTTTGDSGLADTVAQAVYQAIMDAMRIIQASSPQQSDDRELVLKIDNTVLARMQLPALTREAQRQGFNLVLRPQGV